ncbi:MAG: hypothetical protein E7348_04485 [Clostridiales bacterium]|nr:hypothetical protein [Clostridiales bacterium]
MKAKNNKMIQAIAYLVIGILFCVFQSGMLGWLMTAVGVLLVVMGVSDALSKDYVSAIIKIAVGIVIALGGWLFVEIVLLVLGIVVIINGAKQLLAALKSNKKDIKELVISIVTIVFGVMLVVSKWAMMDWLFIIIGVLIALEGVLMLLGKK